jgi:NTP pyrophosphatase (non-canonical NTP hydrolase)
MLPIFSELKGSSRNQVHSAQYAFFDGLSIQVGQWSQYNFDDQLPHRPCMGMLEELGELQEALSELDPEKAMDAVADVTIYMADYYAKLGWNMGNAWADAVRPTWVHENFDFTTMVSRLVKRLAHHHLKGEQGIRGGSDKHAVAMREACSATLWYLNRVCNFLGKDYLAVISEVWSTVSKRDWKKNRDNANAIADAQIAALKKYTPSYEVLDDVDEE